MTVTGTPTVDYNKHISFEVDKNHITFKQYGGSFYDKENNIIFLNDKNLSGSWASSPFGNKNYVKQVIKALVQYFKITSNINIHVGKYNGKINSDSFYADYYSLMNSKENLGGRTLTFYHGTSSMYLEYINKHGLRSLQSTGVTQFSTTGRYYPNQNPVYLTTIPNRAWEYAETAHRNNPKGEPIILKVILPILGNESHFWADDDWLDLQEGDKNALRKEWRKSLKETGQIVYLGRIPASEVELYFPKEVKPIKDITFTKIEKYSDINYVDLIDTANSQGVDYSKICNIMYDLVHEFAFDLDFDGYQDEDDDNSYTVNEALKAGLEGSAEQAAGLKQQEMEFQIEREQIRSVDDNYEFDGFDELYEIIENDKIDETWEDVSDEDKEEMVLWYRIVSHEIKQFTDARTELFS
jgi:hypothetical protein